MKTVLLAAAAVGLAISSVQACPFKQSVQSEPVDPTVVASVATPEPDPVADPQSTVRAKPEVKAE